jgi:hypothetical protein
MLLYIAGIPCMMFVVLFRNRVALWDEAHPDHEEVTFELGGLYTQYEKDCWWFGEFGLFDGTLCCSWFLFFFLVRCKACLK